MIKRSKALLCALLSVGIMTSFNTVNANAMTNSTATTAKCIKHTVSEVEDLMCNLPYTISIKLKEQVEDIEDVLNARISYELLGSKKSCVSNYAVSNLKRVENLLVSLLGDEMEAVDLARRVYLLEFKVGYNKCTGKIFNKRKVRKDKNKIIDEINDIREDYQGLDYAIRYSKGLERCMSELETFQGKVLSIIWKQ